LSLRRQKATEEKEREEKSAQILYVDGVSRKQTDA
jgi:hypothetical protein